MRATYFVRFLGKDKVHWFWYSEKNYSNDPEEYPTYQEARIVRDRLIQGGREAKVYQIKPITAQEAIIGE